MKIFVRIENNTAGDAVITGTSMRRAEANEVFGLGNYRAVYVDDNTAPMIEAECKAQGFLPTMTEQSADYETSHEEYQGDEEEGDFMEFEVTTTAPMESIATMPACVKAYINDQVSPTCDDTIIIVTNDDTFTMSGAEFNSLIFG